MSTFVLPPPHSVAVFVIERFSKHTSAAATGTKGLAVDLRTSLQQGQLHLGVPGATAQAPPLTGAGGRWSDHSGAPLPQSGLGLGFGGGDSGSSAQSRPSGFGQSVAETKEQSTWVHLSAPQHSVTLKIHRPSSFNSCTSNSTAQVQPGPPLSTGSLDAREQELSRPELLIQSGQTTLECIGLDTSSLRQTKLKGLVKGNMIGFRYCNFSPDTNVAETRKFQVKFQSHQDCGQCASILSLFIECRATGGHHNSGPGNEHAEPHRSGHGSEGFQRTESRLSRGGGLSQNQDYGLFSQQSEPSTFITPQFGSQLIPAPQVPLPALDHNRGCDIDQLLNIPDQDLQKAIDAILAHPAFTQLASKIQKNLSL